MKGAVTDLQRRLRDPIIGLQISVQTTESVWQKLLESVGSPGTATIAPMDPSKLRACGLSSKKSAYLVDLAEHFLDGSLDIQRWSDRDDEQLITRWPPCVAFSPVASPL